MIDKMDQQLTDWISSIVPDVQVWLSAPDPSTTGPGVSLYLIELAEAPPARTQTPPPLQLHLRYLVTTWAQAPEQGHRILGDLVFAALENPEFEVDLGPPAPAVWSALGVSPRPAFVLQVPLRKQRPHAVAKPVMMPLVVQNSPVVTIRGRVLGPNDLPVVGARVELPYLNRFVRTDNRGRFHFVGVPSQPPIKLLRVKAKGQEFAVEPPQISPTEPIIIRFKPLEA